MLEYLLTVWTWTTRVEHLDILSFEYLLDLLPQLLIALVNVSIRHDVERGPHQGEQGCIEVDSSIRVESHVHAHQPLAGHTMRTKLSKAERRRNLPEQCYHIYMLYLPLCIWIILRPEGDKLSEVMGTKDGPISGQVIKVIHDDRNKEVEDKEGTNDKETDEVDVSKVSSTASFRKGVIRLKYFHFITETHI